MYKKNKTLQLQIRVSPREKAAILLDAKRAGMSLSEWILNKVLPSKREAFQAVLAQLKDERNQKYVLSEIHDLLKEVTPDEFELMVAQPPQATLSKYLANYVAAMIEYAAVQKGRRAPSWTSQVPPLELPVFGSNLESLRLYLLTHSPPPFRSRNIFIDSTVGERV